MSPQITALRLGSSGPEVRALHQALASLDHAVADADVEASRFGESTRDVVTSLQREHALPPTGAMDAPPARLLRRLLKELAAAGTPTAPAPAPPPVRPAPPA